MLVKNVQDDDNMLDGFNFNQKITKLVRIFLKEKNLIADKFCMANGRKM